MAPKFIDYLTKQLRKHLMLVVIGTTIFFMTLSITAVHMYSYKQLDQDRNEIKTLLKKDYNILEKGIENIESSDFEPDKLSDNITSIMYGLRSQSQIKFNFTVLDQNQEVVSSNLYPSNREILLNSDEYHSAMRQLEVLNTAQIVDNPISGYNVFQKSIMTMLIKTDSYTYIFEPLLESFVELEHMTSSNIIISDRYDNILFDNTLAFGNSLNKVEIDYSEYIVGVDTLEMYTLRTVKEKILPLSVIIYTILTVIITLIVLLQLLKPLSRRLSKTLDAPLGELLNAIEENKDGNLDYFIESHHFTEFDNIYSEFNDLMKSTKSLMVRNEELSETKKLIEIKHLKNQFNPHFIYNTLESIRYEINFNHKNASDMVLALGRLMQYSIENTSQLVTVSEDMKYIEDYLILQKMRFKDRLKYTIDIEDQLLIKKIPKLIIQPIIENSIKHNMEKVNSLTIFIRGTVIGKNVYFVIEDDGVGIDDSMVDSIRESLEHQDPKEENLGLYNINRTIKLMYGEYYGLALENDYGLRVIVNIPIEGEDYD